MSVLIKGGRILTAADDYVGDVYVEGERISLIGESLDAQADKVIDAAGKHVLPGRVDHLVGLDVERLADQGDPLALDVHVADVVVGGGEDSAAFDQNGHRGSPFSSVVITSRRG